MSDRHQIKDDQQFWERLEYAASHWLQSSGDVALRRFWIDGFLPEAAKNTRRGVDVEGAPVGWPWPAQTASVPLCLFPCRRSCCTSERLSPSSTSPLMRPSRHYRSRFPVRGPSPNHALQRTEAGGRLFSAYHASSRQPLSLSLSPLGPESFVLCWRVARAFPFTVARRSSFSPLRLFQ